MIKHTEPIRRAGIQDLVFRWVFTRSLREKECTHLDMIEAVRQTTDICEDCVALGDTWPDLRMCLTCGYIGCCEEAKNQHALKHFKETEHPLIQGLGRFQDFMWCYVDEAVMVPRRVVKS
jgi:uncharacterized UBP type Zn finger protein